MNKFRLKEFITSVLVIGLGVLLSACTAGTALSPTPNEDSAQLSVGEQAPAFTLPSALGGEASLSNFTGQNVLLYFSMTSG